MKAKILLYFHQVNYYILQKRERIHKANRISVTPFAVPGILGTTYAIAGQGKVAAGKAKGL
jgi:hypothetical protein